MTIPEEMSAGVGVDQLKLALAGNVWYLDGGWQTLVDGLRDPRRQTGPSFAPVPASTPCMNDAGGVTVRLANGESCCCRAVILAVEPARVCELLDMPADAPLARAGAERSDSGGVP